MFSKRLTITISFLILILLTVGVAGCTDPEEKQIFQTIDTYLEGFKELDPVKVKRTAEATAFDINKSDSEVKSDLESRQKELGAVQKWVILKDKGTIDLVNRQSMQTVYVYTEWEVYRTTFDLRKDRDNRWKVVYITVEDHLRWSDWPKSLSRLVISHGTSLMNVPTH